MKHPLYIEWTPKPSPDWNAAWQEQREATGRAWWDGFRTGQIPTLGHRINARATLGARMVVLRALVPELEKTARKTPPKTLHAEVRRVEAARRALPAALAALELAEEQHARALERESLQSCDSPSPKSEEP